MIIILFFNIYCNIGNNIKMFAFIYKKSYFNQTVVLQKERDMSSYDKNPDITEMHKYFDFYTYKILPQVQLYTTQKADGCHTLSHTASIVFRGIDYALSLDENPMPVVFAAACHDMARTHDGFDINHGKNAVPNTKKIMAKFSDVITEPETDKIVFAITNHTTGEKAPDYISACLWDADRTRLSWRYGFDARFFNTERAKYVASHAYQDYIAFQKKCFPKLFWSHEY